MSSGKLFLLLALVLLIPLPGCSRAGPDSTQSSLLDPSVVQVRATVNTLFKAFNAHDLDAVMAVYDPRVVKMNPGLSAPQVGRDVVRKIYSDLFTQLPGVRDKVNRIIVEGNQAAVEFTASWSVEGRHGSTIDREFRIAAFLTIEDGMITEDTTYYDPSVLAASPEQD